MLRKLLLIIGIVSCLSACVSEPVDPAFIGTGSVDKSEASKTRVSLGLTYLKNGNFSQAKNNLDKALIFSPRSGEAHFAMAYYYQTVGEADLATEYYEKAMGFSGNAPDIVNSYGVFLCQQGNYDKAQKFFLKAIDSRQYDATAETYENLAICTQSAGDIDGAIEYFNLALNHQPTRRNSLFLLSDLYVKKEQWEEAKKTLWRYERNAPVTADSLYLNYKIADGLNDVKSAVGYGDLLIQNFPDHELTESYRQNLGKFQPAARVLQKQSQQALPTLAYTETQDLQSSADDLITGVALPVIDEESQDKTLLAASADDPQADFMRSFEVPESNAWHVVRDGENLFRISVLYNVNMNKLQEWNQIADPSSIQSGTRIRVKEPSGN